MSTKKLILGIIVTIIVFGYFISYAFNGIQKVELTLDTNDIDNPTIFKEELDFLSEYGSYAFVNGFTLDKVQIVLIDHTNKQAVLWNDATDGGIKALVYDKIPDSIKHSNSYFMKLNNKPSVIMNCDKLLGDVRERLVVDVYKYMYLKQSKLNPDEINYFISIDDAVYERFLRNKMIDALIEAIQNNTSLESFKNYVYKWQAEVGDIYKSIAEYDWYEGSKEWIHVKVREKLDKDFELMDYVEKRRDAYGFYMKEDEYKLIGMLIQIYVENNESSDLFHSQTDIYSQLLMRTPYVSKEIDESEWELFQEKYDVYKDRLKEIVGMCNGEELRGSMTYKDIKSESYSETIRVDEHYYVYRDYKARLKSDEVISRDFVFVRVEPYKIEYYFKE